MKTRETTPGKTYSVHTSSGCTVSDKNGWSKEIAAPEGYFTAHAGEVTIDGDDAADIREVFRGAPIAGGNGGGGVSATGEKVVPLAGNTLEVQHATWFENASQGGIAVLPAAWKNAVATCYLKTSLPVELAGVRWIYGRPTLVAGYTYVVALQQIGADVVLANLAYTIPQ